MSFLSAVVIFQLGKFTFSFRHDRWHLSLRRRKLRTIRFAKEFVGYPFVRRLTCDIVVHAEIDGVDIGIRFQHLKQHLIPDTAGGSVAVTALIFLVQRNKGPHI